MHAFSIHRHRRTLMALVATSVLLSGCGTGTTGSVAAILSGGDTSPGASSPAPTSQTLSVPAAVKRTVDLSWTAPSTRIDDTAVVPSDIGGYRVYYGNDSKQLQLLKDIQDPTRTTLTTPDLPPGTYYFAITAYDAHGTESGLSNIAQKQVL